MWGETFPPTGKEIVKSPNSARTILKNSEKGKNNKNKLKNFFIHFYYKKYHNNVTYEFQCINLLKPTGHVMHQQFNIQ